MPASAAEKKKKTVKTEDGGATPVAVREVGAVTAVEDTPAPKRKSSKKPVKVVAVVTPNGIEGSFTSEPRRPLIAHLQIKTSEVVFHDQPLRYDPNPPSFSDPEPYDASVNDMFTAGQESIPKDVQVVEEQTAPWVSSQTSILPIQKPSEKQCNDSEIAADKKAMPCFTKANLMVQFKGASEQKVLPVKTDIACFWCAHTFDWIPCIIPEREVNGVYNVYGNFCSPECAVSYLLSESIDPHVRWERMALLHRIYDQDGKRRISPAPPRESLKIFGGPMTIESFRSTVQSAKVRVDLHMPPMVSILGSIDTKPIDFFDINVKLAAGGSLPVLPQRSVEEGLRLKRNKPLKDRESTLDTVMNIKIGKW
jgi:hypothetical protein